MCPGGQMSPGHMSTWTPVLPWHLSYPDTCLPGHLSYPDICLPGQKCLDMCQPDTFHLDKRGCTNHQGGSPHVLRLYPARFAIMKSRLLFLKSILNKKEDSRIFQFVKLQLENCQKGNWIPYINCLKNLKMEQSIEEIKTMKTNRFKNIWNRKLKKIHLNTFWINIKKKGNEIIYSELQMADFLLPNENIESIEDQIYLLAIRHKMINIPTKVWKILEL